MSEKLRGVVTVNGAELYYFIFLMFSFVSCIRLLLIRNIGVASMFKAMFLIRICVYY